VRLTDGVASGADTDSELGKDLSCRRSCALRRALLIEQRFGFGLAGGPPEPVTERNTTI